MDSERSLITDEIFFFTKENCIEVIRDLALISLKGDLRGTFFVVWVPDTEARHTPDPANSVS